MHLIHFSYSQNLFDVTFGITRFKSSTANKFVPVYVMKQIRYTFIISEHMPALQAAKIPGCLRQIFSIYSVQVTVRYILKSIVKK